MTLLLCELYFPRLTDPSNQATKEKCHELLQDMEGCPTYFLIPGRTRWMGTTLPTHPPARTRPISALTFMGSLHGDG